MRGLTKNLFIFFLTISAFYLAGVLWFERISSNRNFFYTITEAIVSPRFDSLELELVLPMRIITSFANKTYAIDYLNTNNMSPTLLSTLEATFNHSKYLTTKELDWVSLLNNQSYILEYQTSIPMELMFDTRNTRNKNITEYIDSFDSIIISPGITSNEGVSIVFVDLNLMITHHFMLEDELIRQRLFSKIREQQIDTPDIQYNSIVEIAEHMFDGNAFIPVFRGDLLTYYPLVSINPYANSNQDILIGSVFPHILKFFDTPSAITSKINPGEIIFSDEHTVLRLSSDNILEYSNYRTPRHYPTITLHEAFNIAMSFLNTDSQIVGRPYLTDFSQENDIYQFSFNIASHDFAYLLPQHLQTLHNMNSQIEIVIQSGRIVNYRKWVPILQENTQAEALNATIGFWNAYDLILELKHNTHKGSPNIDVSLMFVESAHDSNTFELMWYISLDGDVHFIETSKSFFE